MKLERSKNSKKNIFWGLVNKLVGILLPFIVRIDLIHYLGANYLGLTSLFSSILQVLSLSELGFGSAVVFSMYGAIARDDEKTLCALLLFYRRVYKFIGILMLLIGLILLPFLSVFIKSGYPDEINIYLLYLLYLLNTVLSYVLFGYKTAVLTAFQRDDIISNIRTFVSIVVGIIQLVVLYMFKNMYLYVFSIIIGTFLQNILIQLESNKNFPTIVCKGQINDTEKKQIWTKIKGLMISKICGITRNSFDNIFLSMFLGLVVTGIYSNYFYVLSLISGILGVIYTSLLAGIGNSIETETVEKNYSDFRKIDFIYMWISCVCTACLLCLYTPFMTLFFCTEMVFPFGIEVFFCAYFYALKMGDARDIYSSAKGLWWEDRFRIIAETIMNFVLNYILGKYFGVYGIIGATLFSIVFIAFPWGAFNCFKYYFIGKKLISYFSFHILYAVVTVLACILSYFVCSFFTMQNFAFLFIRLFVCFVISNLVLVSIFRWFRPYKEAKIWFINVMRR